MCIELPVLINESMISNGINNRVVISASMFICPR